MSNKTKFKYVTQSASGKFSAFINRSNLLFYAGPFTTASDAHDAALMAIEFYYQGKTIEEVRMLLGICFGSGTINSLRYKADFKSNQTNNGQPRTPFVSGHLVRPVTRKEIADAIAAARTAMELIYECPECGAEYDILKKCVKCGCENVRETKRVRIDPMADNYQTVTRKQYQRKKSS